MVHGRYQREEILAALDFPRMPNSFREGVWYSADRNVDAFFITLKKSEADYSPTTMYADYPISPTHVPLGVPVNDFGNLTHRPALSVGSSTVLLFARHDRRRFGTSPYLPRSRHVREPRGRSADRRSPGGSTCRCRRIRQSGSGDRAVGGAASHSRIASHPAL